VACRLYRRSITALIETSPTSCRRATSLHEGGAIFVSKGAGPYTFSVLLGSMENRSSAPCVTASAS
jgi:hypothetical protein